LSVMARETGSKEDICKYLCVVQNLFLVHWGLGVISEQNTCLPQVNIREPNKSWQKDICILLSFLAARLTHQIRDGQ
jgi:hypothetical protein